MDTAQGKQLLCRIFLWLCGIFVLFFVNDVRTEDSTGSSVIVIGVNDTTGGSSDSYGYIYYLYPGDIVGIAFACLALIFIIICCICVGIRSSSRRQQMLAQQNANNAAMYSTQPHTVAIVRTTRVPQYDVNGPTMMQYSQVNPGYYPGYGDQPPIPPYSPPNSYGNQAYPSNLPPSYEAQAQVQQQYANPGNNNNANGQQSSSQVNQQQFDQPVGKFY